MGMQGALASLLMKPPAGGGAAAPPGAPMGAPPNTLGLGEPPSMPGLPPSPEMVGQMPTGSTSTNAKQAADVAISSLRDAKGYYPSMGDAIDMLIAQLQGQAAKQAAAPAPQVGVPGGPGAALPVVPPTGDSGSKGPI